jgi:3-demethoxyubiquinol 3-hydroxylase
MNQQRQFSLCDNVIDQLDHGLRAIFGRAQATRDYPAHDEQEPTLCENDKKLSAALMRINHTGEICAQALYNGQLVTAKNPATRAMLKQAGDEETDHLAWCETRISELGGHTSYTNLFWYWKSYAIGMLAGRCGDGYSLGFVEETEAQVGKHLKSHLNKLPEHDTKSRAVVTQMATDEAEHGQAANAAGGKPLPTPIKHLMKWSAKIMTTTTYYI